MQCIDGHKAYRILDNSSKQNFLISTNHTVLQEIKPYEKIVIENSVIRYQAIEKVFSEKEKISVKDLKSILSKPYPQGLCCHYYPEFFGTLRSMLFDTTEKKIEMTFGSPQTNDWKTFMVQKLQEQEIIVNLPCEKAGKDFYNITY